MVRPRKLKFVNFKPEITYFKPQGVPLRDLEEVELTIDELETLRLSNDEKLNQTEAAEKMDIHQSTFQRTLTRAREKITDALLKEIIGRRNIIRSRQLTRFCSFGLRSTVRRSARWKSRASRLTLAAAQPTSPSPPADWG